MYAKERMQSFLDAFSHAPNTEFYDGACHGLRIALASIEMEGEKERGEARENNHKGSIWNSGSCIKADIRADEKRAKT